MDLYYSSVYDSKRVLIKININDTTKSDTTLISNSITRNTFYLSNNRKTLYFYDLDAGFKSFDLEKMILKNTFPKDNTNLIWEFAVDEVRGLIHIIDNTGYQIRSLSDYSVIYSIQRPSSLSSSIAIGDDGRYAIFVSNQDYKSTPVVIDVLNKKEIFTYDSIPGANQCLILNNTEAFINSKYDRFYKIDIENPELIPQNRRPDYVRKIKIDDKDYLCYWYGYYNEMTILQTNGNIYKKIFNYYTPKLFIDDIFYTSNSGDMECWDLKTKQKIDKASFIPSFTNQKSKMGANVLDSVVNIYDIISSELINSDSIYTNWQRREVYGFNEDFSLFYYKPNKSKDTLLCRDLKEKRNLDTLFVPYDSKVSGDFTFYYLDSNYTFYPNAMTHIYDIKTNKELYSFPYCYSFQFSSDSKTIILFTKDYKIKKVNLYSGETEKEIDIDINPNYLSTSTFVYNQGKYFAVYLNETVDSTISENGKLFSLLVFDMETGTQIKKIHFDGYSFCSLGVPSYDLRYFVLYNTSVNSLISVISTGIKVITGVDNQNSNEEISVSVYPLPALDNISFHSGNTMISMKIYDISNKLVYQADNINTNDYSIITNNFPSGSYFYEIKSAAGLHRGKFIKTK